MRTFKKFLTQIDELEAVKPKSKGEQSFVKTTYLAQIKDPGDLEAVGPEEVGPKSVKTGQGKRPADRLDNKQPFAEETGQMDEADFTKQQTKMAHTIGKEFEKKGVGDKYKGGPYAVATAMVRDKPEAAAKAYKTIKGKIKEQANVDALFKLYNELTEENREIFMLQLEENPETLLYFINNLEENNG